MIKGGYFSRNIAIFVNFATFVWKRVIDPLILQGRGVLFLKSRLQLNHVPVHETHSAKVRRITTTSKTPSLTRIESLYPEPKSSYPKP